MGLHTGVIKLFISSVQKEMTDFWRGEALMRRFSEVFLKDNHENFN